MAAFSQQWQSWVVATESMWHATPKTFTIESFNRKFADIDLEYDWLHKVAEDGWKFNMSKAKFI